MKRLLRHPLTLSVILLLAPSVLPSIASAAPRTVCFRMQFFDNRNECATGADRGRRRACNPGGVSDARGHQVELWDWDASGKDDYIGTYLISDVGTQCIQFEWEGKPYAGNEGQPDPYLRYIYKASNTQKGIQNSVYLTQDERAYQPSSLRLYFFDTCRPNTTCNLGNLNVSPARGSIQTKFAAMIDSAQHTLHIAGKLMTKSVQIEWNQSGGAGAAKSATRIELDDSRLESGGLITHELGHVVMYQQFADQIPCFNYGTDGGHDTDTIEFQSSAFIEGWGEYVRFVSWWNPENVNSRPRIERFNLDVESAQCQYNSPPLDSGSEFQVAKALWDLDDADPAGGEPDATGAFPDTVDLTTDQIILALRQFVQAPPSQQICQVLPNGSQDPNRPNLLDYLQNAALVFPPSQLTAINTSMINHNCLLSTLP